MRSSRPTRRFIQSTDGSSRILRHCCARPGSASPSAWPSLSPGAVVGIGVSAAMHGLIALDQNGSPLTAVVTWADTRAVEEVAEQRAAGQDRELHRETGTPVHPMSPLVKIMWFAPHEPELCARVDVWVSLKTWILRGLTGELVCDLSSASDSGMLDRASGAWHPTALAWAGLDEDRLPPIVPTTHILGLAGLGVLPAIRGAPVVEGLGVAAALPLSRPAPERARYGLAPQVSVTSVPAGARTVPSVVPHVEVLAKRGVGASRILLTKPGVVGPGSCPWLRRSVLAGSS